MPWLPLLLRALLALALVAGGIPGVAMADHVPAAQAAPADAGPELPPCHGKPEPAPLPADDCCGSADLPGCDCPCMSQLAAVEGLPLILPAPTPASTPAPLASASVPAGIAATPLRPPIA